MKTKFIRINNITEIDTAGATVYDMNNRYIDPNGNMYGLKYNRESRRIEIIRILRTPANASSYYDQQMVENKKTKKEEQYKETTPAPILPDEKQETAEEHAVETEAEKGDIEEAEKEEVIPGTQPTEENFAPTDFINQTMKTMTIHRDRLNAIITNLNNSDLVSKKKGPDSSNLANIFRNIDIDGIQRIDKIINTHKELINYPRSITFYSAKLDPEGKTIIESMGDDAQRMEYITNFEMLQSIRHLYRTLITILDEFTESLGNISPDDMKTISAMDKQSITDALTTMVTTDSEIKKIITGLSTLENYIKDASRY